MFTLEFKFKRAQGRDLFYFIFLKKGRQKICCLDFMTDFLRADFVHNGVERVKNASTVWMTCKCKRQIRDFLQKHTTQAMRQPK